MKNKARPSIIVFDVNETLLDLTTLEPLFERVLGERIIMREWFAQLILYSEAVTLSGLHTPFGNLAEGAFRMVANTCGKAVSDADVGELKRQIGSMAALPDAAPALDVLSRAGFRLASLTNSDTSTPPSALEKAGLANFFEASFSVQPTGRFKPAPETYQLVANEFGVSTADLCMVACRHWDVLGAQAAGCMGAFVAREGNAVLEADGLPVPDIIAADLNALAEAIIGKWGRSACDRP